MDKPSYKFASVADLSMLNFAGLSSSVILLAIAIIFVFLTIYNHWRKHREITGVMWEDNEYYNSEGSERGNELQIENEDEFAIHNHPMLPDWLKERKEMIFLQRCIEKGQKIGSGQFGIVFKGKLTLGNAVYVFVF